jgi:histidine phosphotransfer protein HptB
VSGPDPDQEPILIRVDPDLERLIPGFLARRQEDLERLREAIAANDLDTLKSLGHIFKGLGGGYGFHLMTELGGELEQAAGRGDSAAAARLVDSLGDYLGRIEVEYR